MILRPIHCDRAGDILLYFCHFISVLESDDFQMQYQCEELTTRGS